MLLNKSDKLNFNLNDMCDYTLMHSYIYMHIIGLTLFISYSSKKLLALFYIDFWIPIFVEIRILIKLGLWSGYRINFISWSATMNNSRRKTNVIDKESISYFLFQNALAHHLLLQKPFQLSAQTPGLRIRIRAF